MTKPSSISRHGRGAASAIAALAAAAPSSGTYTGQRGDREGCHRQLPLVQLAAYPEYDGKHDHHRNRHGDAGAYGPEQNEFPYCHGKERSGIGELRGKAAAVQGEILSEADALIRLRLKEQGLELPHLVVGTTPDNQIVVRSNGDAEVMRSFGEDLKNVAAELTAPPEPGDTTH